MPTVGWLAPMDSFGFAIHGISMVLFVTGVIMLAVWMFRHVKQEKLIKIIIAFLAVGLVGSLLTFGSVLNVFGRMSGKVAAPVAPKAPTTTQPKAIVKPSTTLQTAPTSTK